LFAEVRPLWNLPANKAAITAILQEIEQMKISRTLAVLATGTCEAIVQQFKNVDKTLLLSPVSLQWLQLEL